MLPLSDLIKGLAIFPGRTEKSIEKEGVAKTFRSESKPIVHEHWN